VRDDTLAGKVERVEMTEPRVVVVILTYNDWVNTAECLDSLACVTYTNFEVLIVDNGSTDGTVESVRAQFPNVVVIANGANLGYAEGNNVGLRWARTHGADYALLLNNDVTVAPDLITELVQTAEQDPGAALLGPLVYHFDEPQVIQSAGGEARGWRFYHRGMNQPDKGQFCSIEPVGWVTGCTILARCSAIAKFGLFDAGFFLYGEELDWCLRAHKAGYQVLFVPQAKVWHKGVQTQYAPGPLVTYYSARNELLLLRKHRAGLLPMSAALLRHLRTLTSYSLRPRWQGRKQHRDALARALHDFARGRFGSTSIPL